MSAFLLWVLSVVGVAGSAWFVFGDVLRAVPASNEDFVFC